MVAQAATLNCAVRHIRILDFIADLAATDLPADAPGSLMALQAVCQIRTSPAAASVLHCATKSDRSGVAKCDVRLLQIATRGHCKMRTIIPRTWPAAQDSGAMRLARLLLGMLQMQIGCDVMKQSAKDRLARTLEGLTLDAAERLLIDHAVDRAGGSLPIAARRLGVSPSTLYRKREKWAGKVLAIKGETDPG